MREAIATKTTDKNTELLKNFPHAGSRVRERSRVRKLTHSPIVVYYQLHEAKHLIEVLHMRHGWRRPPKF